MRSDRAEIHGDLASEKPSLLNPEPRTPNPQLNPEPRTLNPPSLMLLLATVFWGAGFTWAKASIEASNRAAGLAHGALFAPLFTLSIRFGVAALIWFLIFPAARRGWSLASVGRALGVGGLLALGLILQHVGLDRTSEAVSAFLTSLTILFVPILVTITTRRSPRPVLWVGVVLATIGVWMMTGAQASAFGVGELLGLGCSLAFALYILAVNAAVARDDPWRMSGGQFLVVGVICLATCALVPGSAAILRPAAALHVLSADHVALNLGLLTVFATLGAFGLLTHFQPRVEPTRAALIYLFEPVVAAAWAATVGGHGLGPMTLAGAGLILVANAVVEFLSSRSPIAVNEIV